MGEPRKYLPRESPKRRAVRLASGRTAWGTITAPKKPIRKVNPERKAKTFIRCFHSDERVKFVQSLPCVGCGGKGTTRSLNAHIVGDGASRRSSYKKIIPLCFTCHGMQHGSGWSALPRLNSAAERKAAADSTQSAWENFLAGASPRTRTKT